MSLIKSLLSGGFANFPVIVVGDVMLDHYISGGVDRISPEAPVPVIRVKNDRYVLGGAGNVVMNLRGLGVPVKIFGRIGDDHAGDKVLNLLNDAGAEPELFKTGATILKTRVLGDGRQQMLRIDREEIIVPTRQNMDFILSGIEGSDMRAMIFSDYGKGIFSSELCSSIISFCKKKGVPVFVDPKGSDWERYRGAAMVSPNIKELSEVYGNKIANDDAQVIAAGEAMRNKFGLDSLLVTRSERGATLITADGFHHERASAVGVYDVSGAGDTMLSAVAAFTIAGVAPSESVRLANAAAQIVIGKIGTCPIFAADLLKVLYPDNEYKKILSADEALHKIDEWRESGDKVVFTNGCFDILHAGHVDSLARAKALGNRLIIGLNSDDSVRRLKGSSRPVNLQRARSAVLAALSAVDCIVIFDEDTPEELLSKLRPDVIAKGGDYKPDEVAGRQYAKEVVILPILDGYSTTGIIRRVF